MSVIIPTQPILYTDGLRAVNKACNDYITNQTPANADAVSYAARQFVETYLISRDENIKPIVNNINEALSKNRSASHNAEGELVSDIRICVDIIEPKNLVLTMKD